MKRWLARLSGVEALRRELAAVQTRVDGGPAAIDGLSAAHLVHAEAIDALAGRLDGLERNRDALREAQEDLRGQILSLERQLRIAETQAAKATHALLERIDMVRAGPSARARQAD